MIVHKELSGSTVPQTYEKQIEMQDLKYKRHKLVGERTICVGFDYTAYIDTGNNEILPQRFIFNNMGNKVWEVYGLLGDGQGLGNLPIRIHYEVPKENMDLVKICAMGLLYIRLQLQEYAGFYERINYELLEVTNGL